MLPKHVKENEVEVEYVVVFATLAYRVGLCGYV
jgi:hypothetical protein